MMPSGEDRRMLWSRMRLPLLSFGATLLLLGIVVAIGVWRPFPQGRMVEAAATVLMVGIVLVASMELGREPPIIRFFAVIGFFWVAILFTMTLVDYLNR